MTQFKDTLCMLIAITFFLTGLTGVGVGAYVFYYGEVTLHSTTLGLG